MKAGEIVYDTLRNASTVTTIVGQRIYPVDVPLEVDLPCCWYEVTLTGAVDGSAPMSNAQVQVGCVAQTEADVDSLAVAVDGVLDGLTASKGGTWLRSLSLGGRVPSKDAESNMWGIVLAYNASVIF